MWCLISTRPRAASGYAVNVDRQVVEIPGGLEVIGLGLSSPTPWSTPREVSEHDFRDAIFRLADQVRDPRRAILLTHCPPYDSGLETGPLLGEDMRPIVGAAPSEAPTGAAQDDVMPGALALLQAAAGSGITVRLLGGLAVRALCPDYPRRRTAGLQDIDLASVTSSRKALQAFRLDQGHQPDKNFNAMYGHKQLYFTSAVSGRPIDVLIDRLAMCHELDFRDRISRMPHTLEQIVKLNEKDVRDIVYLLAGYPVAETYGPGTISLPAFRSVVADDWGWWRTVTMTWRRCRSLPGTRRAGWCPRPRATTLPHRPGRWPGPPTTRPSRCAGGAVAGA